MFIPEPLQAAIDEFSKLPGIGRKTAQRLALFLLKSENANVEKFISSIIELKSKIKQCNVCFNFSVDEVCEICSSEKRDKNIICVVEEPSDVIAIEKSNEFRGLYHILGGSLSPINGVSPENLHIKELLLRLNNDSVSEVILALNPDTEGEATSLYLARILKPLNIKVSRIARGLPIGGDLEFADEATIGKAVTGRIVYD